MPDPIRRDPSGTSFIRRQFAAALNRYYRDLASAIWNLIVIEDAFGLDQSTQPLGNTRFAFQSNPAKIASFKRWLQDQVDRGSVRVDAARFIKSAYQQGLSRAYLEARVKESVDDLLDFVLTSRERFLRVTFAEAKTLSTLQVLYTRAYDHLDGVNKQMSTAMGRILADGFLAKHKPRTIARELSKQLGISRQRALLIARTEIVRAQATGQLDAYARLGINKLGIKVEWTTADNPCPICRKKAGKVYTIEKAQGLIPQHPRCLCSWSTVLNAKKVRGRRLTRTRA